MYKDQIKAKLCNLLFSMLCYVEQSIAIHREDYLGRKQSYSFVIMLAESKYLGAPF